MHPQLCRSIIAMDDFSSPSEMAAHLRRLMAEPEEYMRLFHWRQEGWARAPWQHEGYRTGMCRLCERLLKVRDGEESFLDLIPDVMARLEKESQCENDGEFVMRWIGQRQTEQTTIAA